MFLNQLFMPFKDRGKRMKDWTKIIADKLNSGEHVILYSVGGDTVNILRALKRKYELLPTALCDKDVAKQGKTFFGLYGLVVMSPRETTEAYGGAYYFVSSLDYKFQIIGELIDIFGVNEEKILNFEPVIKKRSCDYIEKSLVCDEYRCFSFCWYQPQKLPLVNFSGDYSNSLTNFFTLRDKLIDSYNGECGDCCFMKEDYYPTERRVRWINYGVGGICNFDCIYCNSNARSAKAIDRETPHLKDILEYLKNNNDLANDYGINIAPGEPTVHPDRVEIFSMMDCYSNVINTNLLNFNEQLYEITANKFTKLVVSIDSGTIETFNRVKGLNCLDKVCANLKKYSAAGFGIIVLKYVFIPDVNDSDKDIDGFSKICADTGCLIGNISYDYGSPLPIPSKTVAAMRRLRKNLDHLGILCTSNIVYSASNYVQHLKTALDSTSVSK
jgi:hypothetical protein